MIWLAIASATLCIVGSLYALSAKELMRGVLGLALFFVGLAGFFGMQGAPYLAISQVFLFVGGVVTLFVLAFNAAHTPKQHRHGSKGAFIAIALLAMLGLFATAASPRGFELVELGTTLFTRYGLVLDAGLLVLFAGLIGAQYILERDV